MSEQILVIKLGALGDFIYAFGPMAAIRRAHPEARITLLTTAPFEKMARACPYFDEIWIDKKPKFYDLAGWISLRSRFNSAGFSRVYDLQNNDRTAIYLKLFSPKPEWVGAAPGASHRNTSPERSLGHSFFGHKQTLGLAGIDDVTIDPLSWMKGSIDGFGLKAPYVLIIPGSSPMHPEKRWPFESYRTLCARLIRNGFQPVLIGTANEADVTARIARGFDEILDLTGKTTLFDLPSLARGAYGAIGNDTGPIHLTCVTGCPTVVLFCSGKSTVRKHGPQGAKVSAIERFDLSEITVPMVMDAFNALTTPDMVSSETAEAS